MFFELMMLELIKDMFKILMHNIEVNNVEEVEDGKYKVTIDFKNDVIVDKGQLALLKGFASDGDISEDDFINTMTKGKGTQA